MLAVARRLAAQAGTANARFVQGDAQACPLRRNTFDVMISNFGVMFFGDPLELPLPDSRPWYARMAA